MDAESGSTPWAQPASSNHQDTSKNLSFTLSTHQSIRPLNRPYTIGRTTAAIIPSLAISDVDMDLPYEHLMFLLNHRNTIETKFIELLNQRIEQLNIDHNIRNRLITNIDKLSSYLLDINADTNINQIFHFNYDSDEESYVDYPSDDMNSEEYDSYDDIENQIIDQIELESGVTVWFFNARRNQHEHTSDDDSN
ncbi:unnamed protein product [Rotaria sp. Silwood1]|nr:unnamed protein product [Rotaria sp. Silwood1]CAF1611887.1 unnamed protein product [Rotaria sp. Silwood1]CAF3704458.1 unnamed protein product [Rotaria sp. Silwood1]CAF3719576.1 unnamed protein product [Rotaria sp. Silwood1]CAF4757589.1 unnamed protein product [Rotaria sp. Silwood1]